MEQTTFSHIKLTPSEGMFLTQTDPNITALQRVACRLVVLASGASADDWREVDADEAAKIMAEHEAAMSAIPKESDGVEEDSDAAK